MDFRENSLTQPEGLAESPREVRLKLGCCAPSQHGRWGITGPEPQLLISTTSTRIRSPASCHYSQDATETPPTRIGDRSGTRAGFSFRQIQIYCVSCVRRFNANSVLFHSGSRPFSLLRQWIDFYDSKAMEEKFECGGNYGRPCCAAPNLGHLKPAIYRSDRRSA